MERVLSDLKPFASLGDFLAILFFNRAHGKSNPRGVTHAKSVAKFLFGHSQIKMADVLPLIYKHRNGYPSINASRAHEREQMFSTSVDPTDIHHARPFLSTWAARVTALEARRQVAAGTHDDPDDPDDHVQLRAKGNGRGKGQVITFQHMGRFSIRRIKEKYLKRLPLPMMLTEYMSAPKAPKDGVFAVRVRRPHPIIQVSAITSFIVARNRYANGDLAMALGVWHFACKSHVDVKRVYCRLGGSVSDSTSRDALNSITESSFAQLQARIKDTTERGEVEDCLLIDNIQEYCDVYEQGIGRLCELKVGTAGTNVGLQDCAPGAFNAKDYYNRVAQKRRLELNVLSLFTDIDWDHNFRVTALHWVRILAEFTPHLPHLLPLISAMFRSELIAIHRMREGRITPFQPLSTNGERETSTQGLERAVNDFDVQRGTDPAVDSGLLEWIRGDGSTFAGLLRLIQYCAPLGDKFKNKFSAPEIWHTGATELNSTAENHYGPATSSDPSSLSKCSNTAGFKRPSNVKSCDYYPTVRNLTTFWTAHVLDCWRIFFGCDDLSHHFDDLAKKDELPTLEELMANAEILTDRYVSQAAIEHTMSAEESTHPDNVKKVPVGSPWVSPSTSAPAQADIDPMPDLVEIEEPTALTDPPAGTSEKKDAPKYHEERPGFTGDCVLRNSQIFMAEFGWFIEFLMAVPEGDIGRVWQIMKIWIFKFAGSSHQNYVSYLLEVYCFLRYEASKDLSNAVLNNWLVNLPGDLHQEHYNRWLEDMVQKHGAEFDGKFYRETISPSAHHFLQIKEEITEAFSLKSRGKTHTSPNVRDELKLLMMMFKEEEVHLFREGRSMGHAAVNQFARGCRRLEGGKLKDFLNKSTVFGTFLEKIHGLGQNVANESEIEESDETSPLSSSSPTSSRSSSPAPRASSSDRPSSTDSDQQTSGSKSCSPSASVRSNASSTQSILSILDTPAPDEPDDDGVDLSGRILLSGSSNAFYIDAETGLLAYDEEAAEEEELELEEEEELESEAEDAESNNSYSDGEVDPDSD
ncbi:hypothetical protein DFH09DRAFT_1252793 [Mycena vulgaris]|nr:hypothetical protein DFH09DRAFT_1252793 [Mycena vulgaris]